MNGVKAGDPAAVIAAAGGISLGTSGLVLLLEATFDVTEYWDAFKDLWEQDTNNTGNITPGT